MPKIMMRTLLFGLMLLGACVDGGDIVIGERFVGAWVSGGGSPERIAATRAQITNASFRGLLDVAQVNGCGWEVKTASSSLNGSTTKKVASTLQVNLTQWNSEGCQSILSALGSTGVEVHMWIGTVPDDVFEDSDPFIESVLKLVKKYKQVRGIHWDDEKECAPRATLANFTKWIDFNNKLSDVLHDHGVKVSAAVQAMFGIENVPYVKNAPCARAPWEYSTSKDLVQLLSRARVDRFIEMDTYYFTLSRYLDALDWYSQHVPLNHLGVAVANKDVNPLASADEFTARMHALDKSGADWFNIFMMPIDDVWIEYAWRWKTRCKGCPNLGCFEMDVKCKR